MSMTPQRNPIEEFAEALDAMGLTMDPIDASVISNYGTNHVSQNRILHATFQRADGRRLHYSFWLRPDAIKPENLTVGVLFLQLMRDLWKDPVQWVKDSNGMRNFHAYGLADERGTIPQNSFMYRVMSFLGDDMAHLLTVTEELQACDLAYNRNAEQYAVQEMYRQRQR